MRQLQTVWMVKPIQGALPYFGGLDYANDIVYASRENAMRFGDRESAVHCARTLFQGRAFLENCREKLRLPTLTERHEKMLTYRKIVRVNNVLMRQLNEDD